MWFVNWSGGTDSMGKLGGRLMRIVFLCLYAWPLLYVMPFYIFAPLFAAYSFSFSSLKEVHTHMTSALPLHFRWRSPPLPLLPWLLRGYSCIPCKSGQGRRFYDIICDFAQLPYLSLSLAWMKISPMDSSKTGGQIDFLIYIIT